MVVTQIVSRRLVQACFCSLYWPEIQYDNTTDWNEDVGEQNAHIKGLMSLWRKCHKKAKEIVRYMESAETELCN